MSARPFWRAYAQEIGLTGARQSQLYLNPLAYLDLQGVAAYMPPLRLPPEWAIPGLSSPGV